MSRTIYAKKHWLPYLQKNSIASSGYRGSLLGMRRSFWGNDAYVIRCCNYLFKVNEDMFNEISKTEK